MNFDDLNKELNAGDFSNFDVPDSLAHLRKSKLPINKIRASMKSEITTQLVFILIFFSVLLVAKLNPLPLSVYIVFMTLTSLITLLYLAKMVFFVRGSASMEINTKDSIKDFIHDLKLTLEVYKTAIIAGSLLLPIPVLALFCGQKTDNGKDIFSSWFLLEVSPLQITVFIVAYLLVAYLFYYITVKWADTLYGRHIRDLEVILEGVQGE